MVKQLLIVGLPQTVHVSPVLHAVASCALLAQVVLLYMKGARKKLFLPPMRGSHPGTLLSSGRWGWPQTVHVYSQFVRTSE